MLGLMWEYMLGVGINVTVRIETNVVRDDFLCLKWKITFYTEA